MSSRESFHRTREMVILLILTLPLISKATVISVQVKETARDFLTQYSSLPCSSSLMKNILIDSGDSVVGSDGNLSDVASVKYSASPELSFPPVPKSPVSPVYARTLDSLPVVSLDVITSAGFADLATDLVEVLVDMVFSSLSEEMISGILTLVAAVEGTTSVVVVNSVEDLTLSVRTK